jgi:uncharacterized protein YacL
MATDFSFAPINLAIPLIGWILLVFGNLYTTHILQKKGLKSLNLLLLSLALGITLGFLIDQAYQAIMPAVAYHQTIKTIIYLLAGYAALLAVRISSEELHLTIPFVHLKKTDSSKPDILLDSSVLADSRVIDLAGSGILDQRLILPRFIYDSINRSLEDEDEGTKQKARRAMEVIKKLESLPFLNLRYEDTIFPEAKNPTDELIKLAKFLSANILTAEISVLEATSTEGIRFINIHTLSNALKPLMHSNEQIIVKVQRLGREARQGVGYLEDGTMVVVNGAAEHLGKTIRARVLSVKHTVAGRIIFCNSSEEDLLQGISHNLRNSSDHAFTHEDSPYEHISSH